ncbi:hypothetical protein [Aurantivibrio plasticivorans]
MSKPRTMQIRETIRHAKEQSDYTEGLRALIVKQLPKLHGAIQLPESNPEGALLDFVIRYIEHVPNFVDALRGLTKEAGIYDDYASVFITLAEEFFTQPPEVLADHNGLDALMDEAYLAHRLIEEVNDRLIAHSGIPLVPMDMTRANLIVHELIGEPFANDLDFVVHYSTEIHMDKEKELSNNTNFRRYVDEHKKNGWSTELNRWPCLADDLDINLEFESLKDTTPVDNPVLH